MIQFEKPADLTTLLAKHCQIQIQKIFFHMLRKSSLDVRRLGFYI